MLGEYVKNEVKTITDNDRPSITIEKIVKIHTVLPCLETSFFYNGAGTIDKDKLKKFLKKHVPQVMGWYRYRFMIESKFTLRDKIIHKQLMRFFSPPPELFTCGLLSTNNSNPSTHVFKQVFLQYNNMSFCPISISILNLSNPTYCYKVPQKASTTFNSIINDLKASKNDSYTAEDVQNALQASIEGLVMNLAKEEDTMFALEQEVAQMQQQLKLQSVINFSNNNGDSVNGDLLTEPISSSSFTNHVVSESPVLNYASALKKNS